MWFRKTVGFSLYMNILFDLLNVTNVVFEVRSSSFRHHEPSIIRKWGCQRLCMSLWYKELWLTDFDSFPFPLCFTVRSTLSYKENMRFGDSRSEGGKRDPVWVRERENRTSYCVQFVSCSFLPVKSDDNNEKMKLRADAQHCLNVRNAVCVCVWERWWLVGASWLWTVFQTDPQLQGFSDAAHILISSLCRQACCSSFQILLHCLSEPIKRSTQGGCRYSRDLTWQSQLHPVMSNSQILGCQTGLCLETISCLSGYSLIWKKKKSFTL